MSVHLLLQSYAPEWRGAPFVASCQSAHVVVVKSHSHCLAAHVVKQEVAVGVNGLTAEPRNVCSVEQCCSAWLGVKCGDMAEVAFRLCKKFLALLHLRVVDVAPSRHTEAVEVEVHVLHVLGADVELVVGQSHHAALLHLALSLAYLFRIAAVCGSHIA